MRVASLLFSRRPEIERLFRATAQAFESTPPCPRSKSSRERLREYADFTREKAAEVLEHPERRTDVERRLFRSAFRLGCRLRLRLGVRSVRQGLRAARLVYRGLGIDFRASADGSVAFRKCRFASIYTSDVCSLISALDRGLLAGLSYYRELRFSGRITEGKARCSACLVRRTA